MTIIDDLKAINKDIAKEKDLYKRNNKAKYWYVKLQNIYPDYNFIILCENGKAHKAYKIIASVKESIL